MAFQRQQVVGLLVDHPLSDAALAAHSVDGHNRPFDLQHLQQLGDRYDLIRFFGHLDLAKHQSLARREGRYHVDRGLAALLVVRAAHGFAIDGDHALGKAGSRRDPGDKAALEGLAVQRGEDIAATIMGWRAIAIGEETPQECELFDPKEGNLGYCVGSRQHRDKAQKQDFLETVLDLPTLARIGKILEIPQKTTVSSKAVHAGAALPIANIPQENPEGRHRFSTSPVCHVLLHLIALGILFQGAENCAITGKLEARLLKRMVIALSIFIR